MISSSLFGSKKFRGLSAEAGLVYVALVTNADAAGLVETDPDSVLDYLMTWGRRAGVSEDDAARIVGELATVGLIEERGGVASIVSFDEHNRTRTDREGASRLLDRFENQAGRYSGSTPADTDDVRGSTPADDPTLRGAMSPVTPRNTDGSAGVLPHKRREGNTSSREGGVRTNPPSDDPSDGRPGPTGDPPGRVAAGKKPAPPGAEVDFAIEASRVRQAIVTLHETHRPPSRPAWLPAGYPAPQELREIAQRQVTIGMEIPKIAAEIERTCRLKYQERPGKPIVWRWVLADLGAAVSGETASDAAERAGELPRPEASIINLHEEIERRERMTDEEREAEAERVRAQIAEAKAKIGRPVPAGPQEPGPAADAADRHRRRLRKGRSNG
ncbi:MAG: hypothetical protein KC591_14135 [Gemmatimonadetes bacterium]|nr:hypothetical protein [Gemmatimonadota bacterium]